MLNLMSKRSKKFYRNRTDSVFLALFLGSVCPPSPFSQLDSPASQTELSQKKGRAEARLGPSLHRASSFLGLVMGAIGDEYSPRKTTLKFNEAVAYQLEAESLKGFFYGTFYHFKKEERYYLSNDQD
jgi:hypothetical protein